MKLSKHSAIIGFLLLCFSTFGHSQKATHRFIDQVKKHDNSYVMTLPGWLIRAGVNFAIEEELKDSKGIKDIVKGIKQLRFAVIDEDNTVKQKHIDKLVKLSKEEDGLEEYVRVKEDGRNITVLIKENNNRVYNLTIASNSEDEFAIINIKTNISLTDLENADFSFNKDRSSD